MCPSLIIQIITKPRQIDKLEKGRAGKRKRKRKERRGGQTRQRQKVEPDQRERQEQTRETA
jgi:hypothetical protein